ncbi:MAG: VOC family protein [Chloroflexi bacterium]|nr:VOC family protein [Chloroflexota bacterium]
MARITALSFIVPVRDLERGVQFYKDAFGLEEVFRNDRIVFVGLPGTDSALGVLLDPEHAGDGPQTVGFHVDHAVPPDDAVRDIEAAGGAILERGEHAPGVPYARFTDPDGNELWI